MSSWRLILAPAETPKGRLNVTMVSTDRRTVEEFVVATLPQPPARVLEVGAGRGELAEAMSFLGYDVLAIDPSASSGSIVQRICLEDIDAPAGSFDAVVGARVLHHIPALDSALDTIQDLLSPDGLLILHEFAWDLFDASTARWYRAQDEFSPASHQKDAEAYLEEWGTQHAGLHGFKDLMTALERHFEVQSLTWVPYLATEYLHRTDLEAVEREAIERGEINAVAFRYLGRHRAH
jgi:SAM-dependent methyltransferase